MGPGYAGVPCSRSPWATLGTRSLHSRPLLSLTQSMQLFDIGAVYYPLFPKTCPNDASKGKGKKKDRGAYFIKHANKPYLSHRKGKLSSIHNIHTRFI